MTTDVPPQLRMFNKSLKKKIKVRLLKEYLGNVDGKTCFMVTCGDNNGAMNYHLRRVGGQWTWGEFEEKAISEIQGLLGEGVVKIDDHGSRIQCDDASFDCVIVIDCHEHLEDPLPFTREIARITKPGGRVIVSVPNGDEKMMAVRIKRLVGMTKEKYGHVVTGYDVPQLGRLLKEAHLKPVRSSYYSKLFTEVLELCINFAYVMVLSKKNGSKGQEGSIAPSTRDQISAVKKSYMVYSMIYPLFWLISKLDGLLFFSKGYAVLLEASKE